LKIFVADRSYCLSFLPLLILEVLFIIIFFTSLSDQTLPNFFFCVCHLPLFFAFHIVNNSYLQVNQFFYKSLGVSAWFPSFLISFDGYNSLLIVVTD
jgi:hypothetical protein